LANKRISEIAKELGIPSKEVIAKCVAEGVPADKVKSPASTVPIGLEMSIKEWFAAGSTSSTAVETTEHHDAEEIRATTSPAKKKVASRAKDADGDGGAATIAPPAPASPSPVAPAPAAPVIKPAPMNVPTRPTITPAGPSVAPAAAKLSGPSVIRNVPATTEPKPPVRPVAAPIVPPKPPAPTKVEPIRTGFSLAGNPNPTAGRVNSAAPVGRVGPATPPPPPPAPAPTPVAPAASAAPAAPVAPARPAGPAGPGGPSGSGTAPVAPAAQQNVPPFMRGPIRPAPQNVPVRPTGVKPVGTVLTEKAKVQLSGPKVVRIEQAEVMPERRAPRGPGMGGGGGPGQRQGRGIISSGGPARPGTDARNKRRGPMTGPGAAVPAKRKIRENADALSIEGGTGFTEADLAAREAALAKSSGYLKQRRREARAREEAAGARLAGTSAEGRVEISEPFTIKDLSAASGVRAADIIKKLFMQGVMATVNSGIDSAKAQEIMIDFDIELVVTEAKTAEEEMTDQLATRTRTDERPRPPVVTIMGHVDHGKTSLLDAIRNANVAAGEAGGITQKTSAFKVSLDVGGEHKQVVFIDTPGHEAFTEMRSRGANVTDVVVLVVGAPEGVMPQTIESINHARAAEAQIVVALNKIDSPQATEGQIQKVYGQLAEQNLNPIQWGGTTEVIHTSAIKKIGIKELLETLDLQSQVLELKADFAGPAAGRVLESSLTEGRGPVATIIVQEGQLKVGDFIVAGRAFGRVRDITDDKGQRIKTAGPSTPVQISGLDEVPAAGDAFFVTDSLVAAEDAASQRRVRDREAQLHQPKVTLDSLFSQMKDAEVKEILVVLKADVQGSIDAIGPQIEKLSTDEVKVRVLSKAVGGITESDVILAEASKAVVVGFNVIPSGKARSMADNKGVEIRTYQVIYDILDDVKKAASGLLEPEIRQEILGHAEVRKVFNVSKVGTIAGCYVTDGLVQRDAFIRVTRNGVIIVNDRVLEQLKRFKDDAKDVKANMECGMKIVGYDDIKEGDVLECYKKVEVKRTL
jgi:translation initiation factor IF-2